MSLLDWVAARGAVPSAAGGLLWALDDEGDGDFSARAFGAGLEAPRLTLFYDPRTPLRIDDLLYRPRPGGSSPFSQYLANGTQSDSGGAGMAPNSSEARRLQGKTPGLGYPEGYSPLNTEFLERVAGGAKVQMTPEVARRLACNGAVGLPCGMLLSSPLPPLPKWGGFGVCKLASDLACGEILRKMKEPLDSASLPHSYPEYFYGP